MHIFVYIYFVLDLVIPASYFFVTYRKFRSVLRSSDFKIQNEIISQTKTKWNILFALLPWPKSLRLKDREKEKGREEDQRERGRERKFGEKERIKVDFVSRKTRCPLNESPRIFFRGKQTHLFWFYLLLSLPFELLSSTTLSMLVLELIIMPPLSFPVLQFIPPSWILT